MGFKSKLAVLVFAIWALASPFTYAQNIASSIIGYVSDASGAAVPDAAITVTNQGTGVSARAATGSAGTYTVPDLSAGTYTVTVAKAGFETYNFTHVIVLAAATVRQDAVLQVGTTRQVITVAGSAPLVHTDSTTIDATLSTRQMTELPFSTQAIDGLLALAPGAQTTWGASNPQTGGSTHWGGTNFTLNGMTVNDSGNGGASYSYSLGLVNLPDLSSFQEFKLETSDMSAEYRGAGSVTMVTKQGTNQLHGSAYEYGENTSLDANTFLLNSAGKARPRLNRNQFGANAGGPIIKNRAFFFFDFAGLRQRQDVTSQQNLPPQTLRQGNFGAICTTFSSTTGLCTTGTQLYNPFTGTAFAGNQVTSTLITTQAQTLMSYIPLPNNPVTSPGTPNEAANFIGVIPQPVDMDSYTARGDYHLSERDSLFGVFHHNTGFPWAVSLGGPPTYANAADYGYKDASIGLTETHVFSPTMLNDLRVGWFDHANIRGGMNQDFNPQSLFPGLTPGSNRGLPTMSYSGYYGISDVGKGFYSPGYDVQITDNLTRVKGKHTIKAGIDETGYKQYIRNPKGRLGSFSFSGQWTGDKGWPGVPHTVGNSFADFLLGTANSTVSGPVASDEIMYSRDWEGYAQDTWQATHRLTIYYGLRYSYQSPWGIRDNMQSHLNIPTNQLAIPETSSTPTLPPNASASLFAEPYPYTTTQAVGLPLQYIKPDRNNFGPRIGFAFRPFSSGTTVFRGGYGVYYNFNPAYAGPDNDNLNPPWGATALVFATKLSGSITSPFQPDITFANPFPASYTVYNVTANPAIYYMDPTFVNAVSQQWNLTAEHQFKSNWMARLSYVGSQTHHIQWNQSDIDVPVAQIPNETTQVQRPLQPWAGILSERSGGKQNFDQMQIEVIKRVSNGLSFQAEYQWTNSLDNVDFTGGPQNWHFPDLDYGPTDYVRRNQLVFNYVYDLPIGRGRALLGNGNRVLDAFVGGWGVSGITTYGTGTPFSVGFSVPSTYTGWQGGRADRAAGVAPYEKQTGHNITSGVQWFNPSAFAPPQPWAYGNSERNTLFGPGLWNWDMSAFKNFHMTEGLTLEARVDLLDAFNHFNLSNPSSTIADTRDGGAAVPTAGIIYSGTGNRIIQVGLRLRF
jgi:hypothetical protein